MEPEQASDWSCVRRNPFHHRGQGSFGNLLRQSMAGDDFGGGFGRQLQHGVLAFSGLGRRPQRKTVLYG